MTNWKAIAIVFIIIVILETLILGWVYNEGTKIIDNENLCSVDCFNEGGDAYSFDIYSNFCQCFKNKEEIKQSYYG